MNSNSSTQHRVKHLSVVLFLSIFTGLSLNIFENMSKLETTQWGLFLFFVHLYLKY